MLTRKVIVGTIALVLACWIGSAKALYPPSDGHAAGLLSDSGPLDVEGPTVPPAYKPGEIIVKFKPGIADILEQQLRAGKGVRELKLSSALENIRRKHKVTAIRPIFKNFKAKRQRMQALLKNDKVSATSKERRLLRRL
ncbi:MAG: hypothetical protein ACYTEQ_25465, partial [Planctomycetota bacterium]